MPGVLDTRRAALRAASPFGLLEVSIGTYKQIAYRTRFELHGQGVIETLKVLSTSEAPRQPITV